MTDEHTNPTSLSAGLLPWALIDMETDTIDLLPLKTNKSFLFLLQSRIDKNPAEKNKSISVHSDCPSTEYPLVDETASPAIPDLAVWRRRDRFFLRSTPGRSPWSPPSHDTSDDCSSFRQKGV
ncbi:hypothetical protein JTE90_015496 [Oedothorax gibbosus]|uniref:Uncharacterized protein n=1 Tax=Oedothorax gibbosus TaxID=931172 RepID=A0AAV6VPZ4_9ARAC|nr:hypothetical protein JTE90_015496 [Oedothorax gibbosus]